MPRRAIVCLALAGCVRPLGLPDLNVSGGDSASTGDLAAEIDDLAASDLGVAPSDLASPDLTPPPPDLAFPDLTPPPPDLVVLDLTPPPPDLVLPAQCKGDLLVAPTCGDGIKNQDETDIDCGGKVFPKCADGKTCLAGADCVGGKCQVGSCVGCADGKNDQDETDVDCGGKVCAKCVVGKQCLVAADCVSALCVKGVCAALQSCSDGKRDASETDVDCGGGACAGCPTFKHCAQRRDCKSDPCSKGMCTSCSDGQEDGDETDVDCGGSCPACPAGARCGSGGDCTSGWCFHDWCEDLTHCQNHRLDADETDVDCGGHDCMRCDPCRRCKIDDDCMSGNCVNGVCGQSPIPCDPGTYYTADPPAYVCPLNGPGCCCDPRSCDGCCDSSQVFVKVSCISLDQQPSIGSPCGRHGQDCWELQCDQADFCVGGVCADSCWDASNLCDPLAGFGACCAADGYTCNQKFDDANCLGPNNECVVCPFGKTCKGINGCQ